MKIAVSSYGKDLNSQIDPRFGRCAYFLIVNTDDMSFEAFENKGVSLTGGAGIQAGQFVISKGAEAVITGNCGPKAVQTLSASGVELFTGHTGSAIEALEKYKGADPASPKKLKSDEYQGESGPAGYTQIPNFVGGSGIGTGRGSGGGMGMGRGCGGGGGGRGGGCGRGDGNRGVGK
ncbi:MAG: dinitrogenase iron-molybdenum cofactor biosynthesis protein [Desulfobacteraceae bacterium]|nr:dinitrogenase iron-molybdenum cofactor biosynthesis protein [Desulfobacteraceae bacterium]MBC2719042.1 dinitrogenase iron-molybdenum cofactor biosynthesis protein [Desulfobacteraceae bacterium]